MPQFNLHDPSLNIAELAVVWTSMPDPPTTGISYQERCYGEPQVAMDSHRS
jgi:hypothetical protein